MFYAIFAHFLFFKLSNNKKYLADSIPDKSLVGGKVPKCITSTTSTTKNTIINVYYIPIDKNIAKYKVYVNPARWYAGLKYILQLLF